MNEKCWLKEDKRPFIDEAKRIWAKDVKNHPDDKYVSPKTKIQKHWEMLIQWNLATVDILGNVKSSLNQGLRWFKQKMWKINLMRNMYPQRQIQED